MIPSNNKTKELSSTSEVTALTQPLGLRKYRKLSKAWFPFMPMVDFCAMGCLLFLLSSQIIFTPGVSIDLPKIDHHTHSAINSMGVLTILTGSGTDKILFDGYMWNLHDPNLFKALQEFDQRYAPQETNLLVKMDRMTPGQTLHDLSSIARSAGIDRLHIASELLE
jgi:biopolymer transport protein ExbD